jgi:hypothetical protein
VNGQDGQRTEQGVHHHRRNGPGTDHGVSSAHERRVPHGIVRGVGKRRSFPPRITCCRETPL